ncbi:hypothetical protein Ahy_B01g052687 [Arachis hypogaea]|uniref:Endonuclease/exonuclease/phosphatase domain-containing protein n=1 Tax=Arachis hypogaea TaxID=3818 RepID=A0A445AQ40_ARAHY|nr:hypothetical protein Ahy_B01g052687 [Arachis hypogaea]
MIIFSWNCRGAASQSFTRTLKEYLRMHKPDLVILQETRCSGDTARRTIDRSGFAFSHVQDANGFSGRIWIIWNDLNISVKVPVGMKDPSDMKRCGLHTLSTRKPSDRTGITRRVLTILSQPCVATSLGGTRKFLAMLKG